MRSLRAWFARLAGLIPNSRRERELAEEIESHLQLHIEDNIRSGMTPADARRQAILKLGGVEPTKEAYRDRISVPSLEHLFKDARFAMRQLRKNPGFTLTAVLMLALGMCASVTIFAFVDAALIKPLPFSHPERLVAVFESTAACPQCTVSYLDFLDMRRLNKLFRSLDAYRPAVLTLSTRTGAEPVIATLVSDTFFRALGVTPVMGRDFVDGENAPTAPRVALITYRSWQQRYGGNPKVLGQAATLDGSPFIIIGVLPREFQFALAEPTEFWAALHPINNCYLRRTCHNMHVVGRLTDGISLKAASSNMQSIMRALEQQYPASNRGYGSALVPLAEEVVGKIRLILLVLLGGAGLLLLIASVNVASLLLVRSESRKREIAVRTALGASQTRILSQFFTEGVLLVAAGTALGLTFSSWTMQLLPALIPTDRLAAMPYLLGLGFNLHVVAFAAVIALLALLLFSFTPAVRLCSPGIRAGIAEGTRGSSGVAWRTLGSRLVVLELATAVVLLVGAGLLGKSLYLLLHVNLGIQPDRVATIQLSAPLSYAKDDRAIGLEQQLLSRVGGLPGVKSVAIASILPVNNWDYSSGIRVVGKPWNGEQNDVPQREVSSSYFTTLGARLSRGRYFTAAEGATNPHLTVVNQAFASRFFPGEDPIGKQVAYVVAVPPFSLEILGVVEDMKEGPLDSANHPVMYVPFKLYAGAYFYIVARAAQSEQPLLAALHSTLHQIDPNIAIKGSATLSNMIYDSQSAYLHRFSAWLVGGFAALALLLGVIGLYGVVAYSVSQRTREIGIRMALGADRQGVCNLVLKEAFRLTAAGIVIGLAGSLAAAALMRGLLFGTQSWDVATLAAVAALLGISALVASYIPARRAASVSPVEALRSE